jgi:hypothetical protein
MVVQFEISDKSNEIPPKCIGRYFILLMNSSKQFKALK